MLKNNLLCFCLPTCDKEDMFTYLLPSLKNIGELKNYASFSITFQPPYTEEDIEIVIKEFKKLNLNYKYEFKKYEFEEGQTPLVQMRNDCALRYPKALFYALLDDDMQFLPGIDRDYLNLLNCMLGDRNLSVAIMLEPILNNPEFAKRFNMGVEYADFENSNYFTGNGIIYRGGYYYGFDGLLPEDMLKYVGGRQDILMAVWRILQGDSSIKGGNCQCLHYEHRDVTGYSKYKWLTSLNPSVPTCTSWLESVGFIAPILSIFGRQDTFYRNFSQQKCEELYKKGCRSTQTNNGNAKIQTYLIEVDELLPQINEKLNNIDNQ